MTRRLPDTSGSPDPSGEDDRTVVELDPRDLREFEADAETPSRPEFTLPGYELGKRAATQEFFSRWDYLLAGERKRGAASVLGALRDILAAQGNRPEFIDEFVRRLALKAGVELG